MIEVQVRIEGEIIHADEAKYTVSCDILRREDSNYAEAQYAAMLETLLKMTVQGTASKIVKIRDIK
jgi:hypothetical protein